LSVRQVVDSDSQEDVQQGVVTEEHQNYEVQRVDHTLFVAALRQDSLVHHFVPILASQDLRKVKILGFLENWVQFGK
jgi:hypothetical protein